MNAIRLLCCCIPLLAVAARAPAVAAAPPETIMAPDLTVEHTAFVLKLADGRVLRGAQMQGAIVHMGVDGGKVASIKLTSIKPDPEDSDILRHEFQVQDEQGVWKPACQPNFYGETWGFPIALPEGHPGREGAITLTCSSGAVGKCVRFGYKPWAKGPQGEDLTPYHAACVRMVRADYCGDDLAHTKNGTGIDLSDDLGIQKSESRENTEFAFEAGWTPKGAACVARTRWSDVATLEQVRASCPRLAQAEACTEDASRKQGALLFNRSRTHARIGD